MDEAERLKAERDEAVAERDRAQTEAKQTTIRTAFLAAATKMGAHNAARVYALADQAALSVVNGEVHGVDKVLQALKKSDGYLFVGGGALGSGGGNPGGTAATTSAPANKAVNDWIRGGFNR